MNIEKNDYYSREELLKMNFLHLGQEVKISRKTGIYVPEKVWIGNHVTIEAFSKVSPYVYLKDNVYIGSFCALHGNKGIYLENNVVFEEHVCAYSSTSDYSGIFIATAMVNGVDYGGDLGEKIVIGKNSKIGVNCCILPGVRIGDGVDILARSLIRGNLTENATYSGIPAVEVNLSEIERSSQLY